MATQLSFKIYQVLSLVENVKGLLYDEFMKWRWKMMKNDLSTDRDGGIDNMSGNYDVV